MREIYLEPVMKITLLAEDDVLLSSGESSTSDTDGYTDDPFEE